MTNIIITYCPSFVFYCMSDCLSLQNEKQLDVVMVTNGKHTTAVPTKDTEPDLDDSGSLASPSKPGELKKAQKLYKDLTKQNSHLLKLVETLKKEKDSLHAEKQKLKSENKSHDKELRRATSALDSAHSELNRLRHQLVKRGGSTSSLGSGRMESAATHLQLEGKIEQLEAQLAEKEGELGMLQRKLDIQTQLVEREGGLNGGEQVTEREQDNGDFHATSTARHSTEERDHPQENGDAFGVHHIPLDRLLEEQDISSRLRQENSQLKAKVSLMEVELEELLKRNPSDVFQEATKTRRKSPSAMFFKKGRRHSAGMRIPSTSEEPDNEKSKSPDVLMASDSAQVLCSPKSPQHRGAYFHHSSSSRSPFVKSPSLSPRRTRSGTAIQGDIPTLQTSLKLAQEEKQALEEQRTSLEKDLRDARNQIEQMQQSVLSESQRVTKELEGLKHTLETALNEKTTFSERIRGLEKEMDTHRLKNGELKQTIEKMTMEMKKQQETVRLEKSQEQERARREAEKESCKLRKELEEQNERAIGELEMKYNNQVRELEQEKEKLEKELDRIRPTPSTSSRGATTSPGETNVSKSVSMKTAVKRFSRGSYSMDESGKPPERSIVLTRALSTSPKHSTSSIKQPDRSAETAPTVTSPKHSLTFTKPPKRSAESAPPPPTSPKHSSTTVAPKGPSRGEGEGEKVMERNEGAVFTHSKVTRTVSCGTGTRMTRVGVGTSKVSAARALFEGRIDSFSKGKAQSVSPKRRNFSQSDKDGETETESTPALTPKGKVQFSSGDKKTTNTTLASTQTKASSSSSSSTVSKPKTIDLSWKKAPSVNATAMTNGLGPHSTASPLTSAPTASVGKGSTSTPSSSSPNTPGSGSKVLASVRSQASFCPLPQSSVCKELVKEVATQSFSPKSTDAQSRVHMSAGATTAPTPPSSSSPSTSSAAKVVQTSIHKTVHRTLSIAGSNGHSHQQVKSSITQPTSSSSSSSSQIQSQPMKMHTPLTKSFSCSPQITTTDYSHTSTPLKVVKTQKTVPLIKTEPTPIATPTNTTSRLVNFRQAPGRLAVSPTGGIRHARSLQNIPEQVADSKEDTPAKPSSLTNSPVVLRTHRRARADRPMSLNRAETVNLGNMISRLQGLEKGGKTGIDGGQGKSLLEVPAGRGLDSGVSGGWRSGRPASYYGGDASK